MSFEKKRWRAINLGCFIITIQRGFARWSYCLNLMNTLFVYTCSHNEECYARMTSCMQCMTSQPIQFTIASLVECKTVEFERVESKPTRKKLEQRHRPGAGWKRQTSLS